MNKIQKRIKANKIIGFMAFRDHYSSTPGRHSWLLCGKPIYWWKMREALKSKYLQKIVVWTEVKEAWQVATKMSDKFVILKRRLEECRELTYRVVDDLKTPLSRKDISTRIFGI